MIDETEQNLENLPYFRSIGMHVDPFSNDNDDPSFFYAHSTLNQRLVILNNLIKSDDFLILVIGEEGSGKTSMLHQLLIKGSDKWRSCRIWPSDDSGSDKNVQFESLSGHPAFILQNEQLPVIMLDNAHNLSTDELEFLIELAGRTGYESKLKRVILFSESSIQLKLSELSERVSDESITNKIYIPPISKDEISNYIVHRLNSSGYKGKNPFSSSAISRIYKLSGGIPKLINEKASIILSEKFNKTKTKKSGRSGKTGGIYKFAAGLAFAAVNVLGATHFFLSEETEPLYKNNSTAYNDSNDSKTNITESFPIKKIERSVHYQEKIEKKVDLIPSEKNDISGNKSSNELTLNEKLKKEVEKGLRLSKKKKLVNLYKNTNVYREEWLLSQEPSYYTLQILGLRKEESILKFIKNHNLKKEVAFFHTYFQNDDWYPLLYGIYPTFKEAQEEVKLLLKEIRIYSPWVRRLSTVQKEIKNKSS